MNAYDLDTLRFLTRERHEQRLREADAERLEREIRSTDKRRLRRTLSLALRGSHLPRIRRLES